VTFKILIDEEAQEFLETLPKKSQRIIKEKVFPSKTIPSPERAGIKS
jgi:mRNA-degrading endonuclease RelE of RelBE toxin-antitoxin system